MKKRDFIFSIHFKLFLMFLGIMIPLFLLTFINYVYAASSISEQALDLCEARYDTFYSKIDQELWGIYTSQLEMYQNQDLMVVSMRPETLSHYQRGKQLDQVVNRLSELTSQYHYADESVLYVPKLEQGYSSEHKIQTISEMDVDLESLKSDYYSFGQVISRNYQIVTIYPMGTTSELPFAILTRLSEENLRQDLKGLTPGNGEIAILGDRNTEWYLSNVDNPLQVRKIIERLGNQEIEETDFQWESLTIDGVPMKYISNDLFGNNLFLITLIPDYGIQGTMSLNYFFVAITLLFLIFVVFFYFIVKKMVHQPMHRLVKAFTSVKAGNLNVRIDSNRRDEFYYLYDGFDSMIDQLEMLITENYEQKLLMQRAELKLLQAQIDPHFLYNSFMNIYSLAQLEDYCGIQDFTQRLSAYYRYITRNQSDKVRMIQEYQFTQNYIDIQLVRFGDRIRVQMEALPAKYEQRMAPKLFLQPLVENAFKHGFSKTVKGGILQVTFHESGNKLLIRVENSGEPITNDMLREYNQRLDQNIFQPVGEITGIVNVHKRLRLFYGFQSGIQIKESKLGGILVEITICFKEE